MSNEPIEDNDMPSDIDFSKGVRGLHHIPSDARAFFPRRLNAAYGNTSQRKPSKNALIYPIS
jgi:hypothetical protein